MEISRVGTGVRIKGKNSQVVADSLEAFPKVGDFAVPGPGEYEIGGVTVVTKVVPIRFCHLVIDGINVCLLDEPERKLTNAEVELIGDVDILVLKTDGTAEIISEVSPRIVIPLGDRTKLVKEMGGETPAPQNKLAISKDKLPETTNLVILE